MLDSDESVELSERAFRFVEEMATHDDYRVRELVSNETLEYLVGHGYLGQAWPHLLKTSRQLTLDIVMSHPSQRSRYPGERMIGDTYDREWREDLHKRGGVLRVEPREMLAVRDAISARLGLVFKATAETYDPLHGLDVELYTRRFREETARHDSVIFEASTYR